MFSAFKRFAGKTEHGSNCPPSHQAMPGNLQKKFSKGVQYNSKFYSTSVFYAEILIIGHGIDIILCEVSN